MHHQGMDEKQDWKDRLPYPYDQDLSGVLRHLDRRTPSSRAKLANNPATAGYLAAAMRLVERHLGPNAVREPVDPDDINSIDRPLLRFLSQREIVAEMTRNPDPLPRRGSVAALRSTWRSQSDFIADVLSFALWPKQRPPEFGREVTIKAERLLGGPDFVDGVHDLAYFSMRTALGRSSFRFELAALAEAEGDDVLKAALAETYQGPLEPWKRIYEAFGKAHGLRLRPGVTLDDFADILAALETGLVMRAIGYPQDRIIDSQSHHSLSGTAVLAVILGCFERTEEAAGLTIEQAVHELVYDRPNRVDTTSAAQ